MASPSPSRDGDRMTPVGSTPVENQYLRFDLEELGNQFRVRAGDLVRALEAHRDEQHYSANAVSDVEAIPSASLGPIEAASGSYDTREYSSQGLVVAFVGADQAPVVEQEQLGSRGLLSEMLRSSAEPTVVETSMTGVLRPRSAIGEDMQAEVEAEKISTSPRADMLSLSRASSHAIPESPLSAAGLQAKTLSGLSDLEAPLLVCRGDGEEDSVAAQHLEGFGLEDEQPHGYLVEMGNSEETREIMAMETPPQSSPFLTAVIEEDQPNNINKSYILAMPQMAMKRENSVALASLAMPSDIEGIAVSATSKESHQEPTLSLTVRRQAPVLAYVMLAIGIWGISVNGSGFRMETPAHPLLKSLWRSFVAMAVISPWVAAMVWIKPRCLVVFRQWPILRDTLITAFAQAQYIHLFVAALNYTGMATAFLLSNCHSMIIVIVRLVTGDTMTRMEALGVVVSLGGAALTIMDTSDQPHDQPSQNLSSTDLMGAAAATSPAKTGMVGMVLSSIGASPSSSNGVFGGFLAFLSGIGGAIYVTAAGRVRHKVEFSIFMWLLFAIHVLTFLGLLVSTALVEMHPVSDLVTFDMHPYTGFIGFLSKEQIFSAFLTGVVGSVMGICVYIAVIKYLDPVVVSVAMLSESFVGVFSGVLLREANWPGLYGWAGSLISVAGALVVIVGARRKNITTVVKPPQTINES